MKQTKRNKQVKNKNTNKQTNKNNKRNKKKKLSVEWPSEKTIPNDFPYVCPFD